MPVCTVFAGPNGAGKSTAFSQIGPPGEFVNADETARRLNAPHPEAVSLQAGRLVLARVPELIAEGADFTFETTLSSQQSLTLMRRARQSDYRVELVFIGLRSPALHLARVEQRVAQGGHDIPDDIILRRYERSFDHLPMALQIAHSAAIFDNTERELHPLARIDAGAIGFTMLERGNVLHVRIAAALAKAFGLADAQIFVR
jgi:predicted ABC-type ATPase